MCLSSITESLYSGIAVENSEKTEEAAELPSQTKRLAYQLSAEVNTLTPFLDGLK